MKKRGFGAGKYNGFGGKPLVNETIIEAAIRELQEESSIIAPKENLVKAAELTFIFPHQPEWNQIVHVFTAGQWKNQAEESDEMQPAWFDYSQIPFHQMWADDKHWLPLVLQGEKLTATFTFEPDNETIKEFAIQKNCFFKNNF